MNCPWSAIIFTPATHTFTLLQRSFYSVIQWYSKVYNVITFGIGLWIFKVSDVEETLDHSLGRFASFCLSWLEAATIQFAQCGIWLQIQLSVNKVCSYVLKKLNCHLIRYSLEEHLHNSGDV